MALFIICLTFHVFNKGEVFYRNSSEYLREDLKQAVIGFHGDISMKHANIRLIHSDKNIPDIHWLYNVNKLRALPLVPLWWDYYKVLQIMYYKA